MSLGLIHTHFNEEERLFEAFRLADPESTMAGRVTISGLQDGIAQAREGVDER